LNFYASLICIAINSQTNTITNTYFKVLLLSDYIIADWLSESSSNALKRCFSSDSAIYV